MVEINISTLSDLELVVLCEELNATEWSEDSMVRRLATQKFGYANSLTIVSLSHILLPEVTRRLKMKIA